MSQQLDYEGFFYLLAESPDEIFWWLDKGHVVKDYYFEYASSGNYVDYSDESSYPNEVWVSNLGDNAEFEVNYTVSKYGIFNRYLVESMKFVSPLNIGAVSLLGKINESLRSDSRDIDSGEITSENGSDLANGFWGIGLFKPIGRLLKPFFDLIRPLIQKVLSKLQRLFKQYWWLLPLILILIFFFYKRKYRKKK